jgi:TetR/AcrR family transcriptional regulator, mexJK operon transcriptional repressor
MTNAAGGDPTGADDTHRSAQKRKAILDAATEVFLASGYLGTNMDEIAALSGVSKQTVYKHFSSKEALFVEIVLAMTGRAGDQVRSEPLEFRDGDLAKFLEDYAIRQLTTVLTPRLMQLRRLVVGEVSRFPELARALYEAGPKRAMTALSVLFEQLGKRGLLRIDDPWTAAQHYNWLVMSEAINAAMLLGDAAMPSVAQMKGYARDGVRVFLAAYGTK